jgi:4-hydroxybenzoyl-CoA thioesterase/acyl-CoA thioester hydrolase
MPETFTHRRRIEFRETDMAGIVHFSNFFAYMEQAEHALLRSVGMGVICEVDGLEISWPRVNAQCDYKVAIKFEEMIDIEVSVTKIGTKSVTYGFDFLRENTKVASGSLTTVCCLFKHGQKPESIPTPQGFIDAIGPFLVSPAEDSSSDEDA